MAERYNELKRELDKDQFQLEDFKRGRPKKVERVTPKIIVDNRELGSPVVKELSKLKANLQVRTLAYGDFILSERFVVERKTPEDFTTSIIDGRLFEQASNLKSQGERPILLIEGPTLYTYRKVRSKAIFGAISSLLIDFTIPVMWTQNPSETALLLYAMARREQSQGFGEPRIRCERKPMMKPDLQEFITAGLPNVDNILAKRLLAKFKTVEKIFTAPSHELREVEGIGEKKSRLIRDVLTSDYRRESADRSELFKSSDPFHVIEE